MTISQFEKSNTVLASIEENHWFGLAADPQSFRYECATSKTDHTIIIEFDTVRFYQINVNYTDILSNNKKNFLIRFYPGLRQIRGT